MSSFVKMALATSIQRLYEKREEDKLADFIIESKDGVQTKVHSLILLSRGSMFLETLLKTDGDFEEKKTRKLIIPDASSEAVDNFVRILYGIDVDLDDDDDGLDILKDLIMIGGVYDASVQEVATEHLKNHLTKENVFEILELCKSQKAESGVKNCLQMIVNNFSKEELYKSGQLKDHPDLALKIIGHDVENKNILTYSKFRTFNAITGTRFDQTEPSKQRLMFTADTNITVTGIGLCLTPGSTVSVTVEHNQRHWTLGHGSYLPWSAPEQIHEQLLKNVGDNFVPVRFKEPLEIKYKDVHDLLVSITGRGGTYAVLNTGEEKSEEYVSDSNRHNYAKRHFYERTLDGIDKNGHVEAVEFKFYFKDNWNVIKNNVIADIYFNSK